MDFEKAKNYILNKLQKELPTNLSYHSYAHTLHVHKATINLAKMEGVEGDDLSLMEIAALYHDAGFIYQYLYNEQVAAKIARETLPNFGYTPDQVKTVEGIIMATVVNAIPQNLLEQIVKDADLDYLGDDDFHPISTTLKNELNLNGFQFTDAKWDQVQLDFLGTHVYYTKSAMQLRNEKKQKHFKEIQNRVLLNKKNN